MRHVASVAGRELRSLFVSPVAYVVLSLVAVTAGLFFVLGVAAFNAFIDQIMQMGAREQLSQLNVNDALIVHFYDSMSVVLLFLIPGITMGLFASEKTNGTQELLLTSPLTMWDIVLGKYAAAAIFVSLLVLLMAAFPGLLFFYTDPEVGKTVSGLLGVLLVGWTYVAIGAFASSITRSQVVSFLTTFVLLLFMMLLPAISALGVAGGAEQVGAVLRYLSAAEHLQQLLQGLVDTSDLVYFAATIGVFMVMTKTAVESVRWR